MHAYIYAKYVLSPWLAADKDKVSHVLSHVVWWKKYIETDRQREREREREMREREMRAGERRINSVSCRDFLNQQTRFPPLKAMTPEFS